MSAGSLGESISSNVERAIRQSLADVIISSPNFLQDGKDQPPNIMLRGLLFVLAFTIQQLHLSELAIGRRANTLHLLTRTDFRDLALLARRVLQPPLLQLDTNPNVPPLAKTFSASVLMFLKDSDGKGLQAPLWRTD